jgi:putative SOS response-associated peptidase YedK
MCNLYSITTSQQALRDLFRVTRDRLGNLPPLPAVFPDYAAPVIRREADGARAMDMMRWGIPGPVKFGEKPCTNIRNVQSPHWRPWLRKEYRCLVPASSFSEYTDSTPKIIHWFALDDARPPFAFAGIWRPWRGTRGTKANPVEGEHLVFSFLTCEPNDLVRPVHSKAMPVILTGEDCDTWLEGETAEALALQKPFPADLMKIVAVGARLDGPTSLLASAG